MNTTTTTNPAEAYADCHTPADISARHRSLWDEAAVEYGDYVHVPSDVAHVIREGYRLAHVRLIGRENLDEHGNRVPRQKRQTVEHVAPPADGEKDWTIVCPECGEDLPARKFATVSGKPGYRENTCRQCKAAKRNGGE